jgi:hypothetical protein
VSQLSLSVILPIERNNLGVIKINDDLTGLTVWGHKFCYGRADHGTAGQNGNANADPTQPYGDTPTGGFDVVGIRPVQASEMNKYGSQDALMLKGVTGQAMIREANSGHQLLIHGGRPSFGTVLLRPTNGCLRLLDQDMKGLLSALGDDGNNFPYSLNIVDGDPAELVAGGPDDGYEDPATA